MGNESTKEKAIVYSDFLHENLTRRFPKTNVIERMHAKVLKKLEHNVYFDRDPFKDTPKWLRIYFPFKEDDQNKNTSPSKDSPSQMTFKTTLFSYEDRDGTNNKKSPLKFPGAPRKILSDSKDKFFLSHRKMTSATIATHRSNLSGISRNSFQLTDQVYQNENSRAREHLDLLQLQEFKEEDVQSENFTPQIGNVKKSTVVPRQTKILLNCSLEEQLFKKVPPKILYSILEFLIDDYQSLILVSSLWHFKIKEVFDSEFKAIDLSFSKCYREFLTLKDSYSTTIYDGYSSGPGFRIDRNLIAETKATLTGSISPIFRFMLTNNLIIRKSCNDRILLLACE